jgi:ABC-type Fe3+ transport system permease subunit
MSRRQEAKGVAALITLFIVLVLAAVALPFIGGRNMVRGYNRTPIETAFLTVFANAALIVCGAFVGAFVLGIFIQNSSATANSAPDYVSGAGLSILSSIIGAIWGYSLRAQRLERFPIILGHNRN